MRLIVKEQINGIPPTYPKYDEVNDPLDRIRYYKGKYKCIRITKKSYMGTALYRMLETAMVGNQNLGYREVKPGELIAGPVRVFHIKKIEDDMHS